MTAYVTTDLTAVPLLWVAPLALYLLTFVLAFARRPLIPPRLAAAALPVFVLCLALALLIEATEPGWFVLALHLVTFFAAALACHGALAAARPPAERLTEFYLWVSLGGVLGGLFNVLAAPVLFRHVGRIEYPLALVLACALLPDRARLSLRTLAAPLALGALTAALALVIRVTQPGRVGTGILFGGPLVLAYLLADRPRPFALGLGAVLLAGALAGGPHGPPLFLERNFFGELRVTREPKTGWHRLVHGHTIHGRQAWDREGPRPEPLSYYHRGGPAGQMFKALNARPGGLRAVAVCGLGAGALAAYARPGQAWTFYEIDPAVARVALDRSLFTYLADHFDRPEELIVLGDARLRLREAADGAYDLLVIDCFSSDAIPVHLLTREALVLYQRVLAPDGVLAFHISNRYLDLGPVLANLARDAGLHCRDRDDSGQDPRGGIDGSRWAVMARRPEHLRRLAVGSFWTPTRLPPDGTRVWTDDYANVLGAFRW